MKKTRLLTICLALLLLLGGARAEVHVNEMPPDCDWVLVGRSALKGRKTSDVAAELRWMCGRF